MYRKCKVVMLPTNEKALIYKFNETNKLIVSHHPNQKDEATPQHLYILSDDEIKNGDHVCPVNYQGIWVFQKAPCPMPYWGNDKACKKIIASTNSSLSVEIHYPIAEGRAWKKLPQPSQSFIDKYVSEYNKGNIITDVMVEYFSNSDTGNNVVEWNELKVNPKDNTITTKKLKDSWTKDEVINLIRSFRNDILIKVSEGKVSDFTEKWIETNLN